MSGVSDFWDDGFDKLIFKANKAVTMCVTGIDEINKDGKTYIKTSTKVIDGEHKGQDFDIFSKDLYMNEKIKKLKINPTLGMVMNALARKAVDKKVEEAMANGLEDREDLLKTGITAYLGQGEKLVGAHIELVFKPKVGDYQNIKSIKRVKADAGTDAKKADSSDEEDGF